MSPDHDPFSHHPELRGLIADPLHSNARNFTASGLKAHMQALGVSGDWLHTDAEREASRAEALGGRLGRDLWVFAYGSLIWDPGFQFADVRRARVSGYARRFILKDVNGGRGTNEKPGLMAALDRGPFCDGLLFRIASAHVDMETEILWRREKAGPAYIPSFVTATFDNQVVEALTFVADHGSDMIQPDLTRAEQIELVATGSGFLGTSLDYLINIDAHLKVIGIVDQDIAALRAEVEAIL